MLRDALVSVLYYTVMSMMGGWLLLPNFGPPALEIRRIFFVRRAVPLGRALLCLSDGEAE